MQVTGEVSFKFTMEEIRKTFGEVQGKDLHFKAWVHDWEFLETQNGTSSTEVIHDGIEVKLIGRRLRTFKPRAPFTVYVSR